MTENSHGVEFYVHNAAGQILRTGYCPADSVALQAREGETAVTGTANPATDRVVEGELQPLPPSPHPAYRFDYAAGVWIDPANVAELQASARAAINQWRDQQENAGTIFEYDGCHWDCGLKTRERLQPVLALPALPDGFFWTDADNVDRPMDMPELQALNAAHEVALVARGFAIHARQRAMKEALDTMTAQQLRDFAPGWD